MKYILALIFLPLLALAEAPAGTQKTNKKLALYELVIGQNTEDVQTGKSFFVRSLQNHPSAFEKSFYDQLKLDLEEVLRERGYEKARDRKSANLLIDLEMYKNKFVSADKD